MKKIIIALGFFGILAGSATSVFAGYFNTTPIISCDTQITHTLQIGSENNDVYVLQNMLSHAGYLYATPNGYFGQGTKTAVKRFQVANGIAATGIVGESTRNAVNERLCDTDVRGDTSSYDGYTSGITYVDQYDPYAVVISPQVSVPSIYATPQETIAPLFSNTLGNTSYYPSPSTTVGIPATTLAQSIGNVYVPTTGYSQSSVNTIIPATSQVQGTSIVYNPSIGYTYGLTQKSGSLTIISPSTNAVYREGDTVNLSWTTSNLNASGYQILLENTRTGQSKHVAITSGNSVTFVLTKELLDTVCAGGCDTDQQSSFKIVIETPVTDIAGVTSNFRAAVSPITIRRPYSASVAVSLTTSKTPVDSGEKFRLYVNTPTVASWNTNLTGDAVVKIHAICINSVQVSIAGVPCGQELVMPLSVITAQQGVPTMITNTTWYKQDVTFEVMVSTPSGLVIGTAKTTVTANSAPFSW